MTDQVRKHYVFAERLIRNAEGWWANKNVTPALMSNGIFGVRDEGR